MACFTCVTHRIKASRDATNSPKFRIFIYFYSAAAAAATLATNKREIARDIKIKWGSKRLLFFWLVGIDDGCVGEKRKNSLL